MTHIIFKTLLFLFVPAIFSCSSKSDIIIADFEKGTFKGWIVEGEAFGSAPVKGAIEGQQAVTGYEGEYLANSFHGGDDATGMILSSEFVIERDFINFLLGGGRHSGTYIGLLIDNETVCQSRPVSDSEKLEWMTWNIKKYNGKKAQIKVVDNQRGGWGHILVDNIEMSNKGKSDVLTNYELSFKIDKKYLLLPMEDQAKEYAICLKKGNANIGEPFTVRIAQDRIDYWVPVDVEKYKGEDISIVFENIDKKNIGYSRIYQSDDFHFDYNETYRPNYHFSPRYGWTNDPNGMVYHNGEYHLFYQHNPYGTMWGNMSWGHTVSKDLIRWEHLPVAIFPDSLGTIFSGSIVIDKNNTAGFGKDAMIAVYTSAGKAQTQSIAYSLDNGRTFTKYDKNPVLSDINYPDFRDPKLFWHNASRKWVMSLATGQKITFYGSANLKEWVKLSEFGEGIGNHGGVWECPDLFSINYNGQAKWVLLVSINPGGPNGGNATQYFIGNFDGRTFKPDDLPYPLWIDYGRDNYAGITWNNAPDERRLFIGWMSNWDYANQVPSTHFKNAMTIPRELKLIHNGRHLAIASEPIAELTEMRSHSKNIGNISVDKEYIVNKVVDNENKSYEIGMVLKPKETSKFSFKLANRKGEELNFIFDQKNNVLSVDRSKSGLIEFSDKFASEPIKAPLKKSGSYKIRLFIDKASSELFINDGEVVVTNIVFPAEAYSTLQFNNEEGSLGINNLTINTLK